MPPIRFPDPNDADEQGIVAVGGALEPEIILTAYRQGIFPWPAEDWPLLWFSPPLRAVLRFADLHLSRSLGRALRRAAWTYTVDAAFPEVIATCARIDRNGERGTWITPPLERAYTKLHRLGYAHSVEVWEGDVLVGGIYGVDVDGAFAAESMFHRRSDASKAAFVHLVRHLAAGGLDWIDIQIMTPHMQRFGAMEIPRREFLGRLQETRRRGLQVFPAPPPASSALVPQPRHAREPDRR